MPTNRPLPKDRLSEALENSPSAGYWPLCALVHAYFLYLAVLHTADPRFSGFLELALCPVHEMGHVVFRFLGLFMGILGGSLLQWLVPLLLTASFVKQKDLYATTFGLFLFGISLNQSYCYMDSSFKMEKYPDMVFVSLGSGEATHDWQYIFGTLGMYRSYEAVALLTRSLGLAIVWCAWIAGAWLLWKTARRRRDVR